MQRHLFGSSLRLALAATFLFWSASAFAQEWTPVNSQPMPRVVAPERAISTADYTLDEGYILDSGDKIRVTVFGKDNETLGGDFELDGTGLVRLPLIGTLRAGGLTARAFGETITQALAAGYVIDPRVAVSVITYRPFFILGEVGKPGAYPYANNMSAITAIALAGGHTPRAVSSTIYIQRQGETAEREYPADQRTKIYPGDVVRVPDTVFWRVMSYVIPLSTFRPY